MRVQGGRREQRALAPACIANAYQTEAVVPSLILVKMRPQHGRPTYQGKVAAVAPSTHARGLRFTSCNTAGIATYIPSLARSHPTERRCNVPIAMYMYIDTLPHIGSTNPGSFQ